MIVDNIIFLARNPVTHEWVQVLFMFSNLPAIYIYPGGGGGRSDFQSTGCWLYYRKWVVTGETKEIV
jgi:hypothetical protein